MTAVSLAYWIMDDGSYNKIKGTLIFCTDSYSKEDVLLLIRILTDKFNLSCGLTGYKIRKDGNMSYRIRINKSSMPSLIDLTRIYILPSMVYKLGL
jgi:hypothetical protein